MGGRGRLVTKLAAGGERYMLVQSTVVISKSKVLSEILRDIRTST